MKTPFFSSMLNMLPGLSSMILMGHILNVLIKDPSLIIILDAPSSGHTMTMLEAANNFHEMFGEGIIVEDIKKMKEFLLNRSNTKTIISCLPNKMALNEGVELRNKIKELGIKESSLIVNDTKYPIIGDNEKLWSDLPDFMHQKISLEKEIINCHKDELNAIIPHISEMNDVTLIESLIPHIKQVI